MTEVHTQKVEFLKLEYLLIVQTYVTQKKFLSLDFELIWIIYMSF